MSENRYRTRFPTRITLPLSPRRIVAIGHAGLAGEMRGWTHIEIIPPG
jgi:hypothetical protein